MLLREVYLSELPPTIKIKCHIFTGIVKVWLKKNVTLDLNSISFKYIFCNGLLGNFEVFFEL
jgi:hypothetical protein